MLAVLVAQFIHFTITHLYGALCPIPVRAQNGIINEIGFEAVLSVIL